MSTELDSLANAPVADDETLFERRYRFLTQRLAGGTFRGIAEKYNRESVSAVVGAGRDPSEARTVSPATVRKDIEWAKRDIIDGSTREALIAEETQVLLDVRRANYAAMVGGDVDAAKIVLSTVTQRRELWGLDAPKRSQIGVGTDVEFAADLVDLIQAVGATAPKDLLFAAHGDRAAARTALPAAIDAETIPFDLDAPEPPPEKRHSDVSDGIEAARERREGDYWDETAGEPWSNL